MTIPPAVRRLPIISYLVAIFLLLGCEEQKPSMGKFGMMNENTPEFTAVTFMESIYKHNDIDTAIALSSDQLASILRNYHTPRNVQRHLLNLPYDEVIITPQGRGRMGRSEFSDKARVTMFFSGEIHGQKKEELRSVEMVRIKGAWRVSAINPDYSF